MCVRNGDENGGGGEVGKRRGIAIVISRIIDRSCS